MIRFEKVSKSFGDRKVIKDLSFEIAGGEFVSIVGPSAAGKSTVMHLLLGADKPDQGEIKIDNLEPAEMNSAQLQAYRRKVGVVFQDYKLLPQKTVFENIAFALEVVGYGDTYVTKRVNEVLEIVGLKSRAHAKPSELSGGEKQKTALARALVHAPELMIADEPTGNLDPKSTEELIKLLLKINKSGTTVILTTHDDRVVDQIKQRVIFLKEGKMMSDKKSAGYPR